MARLFKVLGFVLGRIRLTDTSIGAFFNDIFHGFLSILQMVESEPVVNEMYVDKYVFCFHIAHVNSILSFCFYSISHAALWVSSFN